MQPIRKALTRPRRRNDKSTRPKARKNVRRSLEKRADQVFSLWIRNRDGKCRGCGTTKHLQCAHIVSRRYRAVRWTPSNAVALCRGCHMFFTMRPLEWDVWVVKNIGATVYAGLKKQALAGIRTSEIDYAGIIKAYEAGK